jgi:hypothetical protein
MFPRSTPTKVECWPSAADQLQQDQLQPGRTMTIKVFERGSGGLFGGDQLIGEANVAISKFIFNHSRDDASGVTVSLTKKDVSRGDVTIHAEATGVSAVIDALGSALAPAGSQVPQLFGWACDTLANLSKQNKLKFQQYASAELLDSLASLTLAAYAASASSGSTDKKKEKEKSKSKAKDKHSGSKATLTVKLDEQQRGKLSALWKSMVEQELRKSLIANGLFSHLNKFLDPALATEELLLLGLDLCKPFFTVASHQRELVTQGVAVRIVRLVESASLNGAALAVPVSDRVRSKGLDCLLYFDTPLHSDLVDLGLGSALISLIAHKTIAGQLRLRCLELLTTLDGNQQKKMTQLEEQNEAKGISGGLVANLLSLLQDATQPALQLKSLSYLSNTLATQDAVMDVLVKKGILTPLVRMLSQNSTPTTANHVSQLRSLAVDIIKKVRSRFAEKLLFETSFVRDLAILLLIQEQSALDLLDLFLSASTVDQSDESKKLRQALLFSAALSSSPDVESPCVPPKMPILKMCLERLMAPGLEPLKEHQLTSMGLPAVFLDFFNFDATRSTKITFEKLRQWSITPEDVDRADAWSTLMTPLKAAKTTDPCFLPLLEWLSGQDWAVNVNRKLAERTAPLLLAYINISVAAPEDATSAATSVPEKAPVDIKIASTPVAPLEATRTLPESKEEAQPVPPPVDTVQEAKMRSEYDPRGDRDSYSRRYALPVDDEAEEEAPSYVDDNLDEPDLDDPNLAPSYVNDDLEVDPYYLDDPVEIVTDLGGDLVPDTPIDSPATLGAPSPPIPPPPGQPESNDLCIPLPNPDIVEPPAPKAPRTVQLEGAILRSVWKLSIQIATSLSKVSAWGLLDKVLDLLISQHSALVQADRDFLAELVVPLESDSSSQPVLFGEWACLLARDFGAACKTLFQLWRTPYGPAYGSRLYAKSKAELSSEFTRERLQTSVFSEFIAMAAMPNVSHTEAISAIKLSEDWADIVASSATLLDMLVNATIVPVLPASERLSAAVSLFRELLMPIWNVTKSSELLFGSGKIVHGVVQAFISSANAGEAKSLNDSKVRSYIDCLFEVLVLEPVVQGLAEQSRWPDLADLMRSFFNIQWESIAPNVYSNLLDKSLAFAKMIVEKVTAEQLREMSVHPGPLCRLGAFCLLLMVENKVSSSLLEQAFSVLDLLDKKIANPPEKLYHSMVSAFSVVQRDSLRLLSDMLKSSNHELVARALHTLATSKHPSYVGKEHVQNMLSLAESASILQKLPDVAVSHFISILQAFHLHGWMEEGTEVYSFSPPTLQSTLATARRKLLRNKEISTIVSAPPPVAQEADPSPSSSSSSSSSNTSTESSGGAGSSPNGLLTASPQVLSQGSQLSVLATWFSAGGVPYDKVGYVQLFDSKADIPSNSTLLNSIKGKPNILVVIKTRSEWAFGAFCTKPIPDGATTAPGSVRDVSAFLFTLKRPGGPSQPQKFSIRYSEAGNALQYNQGKFVVSFGRDDIGINLDSAIEKVKVSDSGQFSYLLPSNTASKSFFTGTTYVDFEQLLVFQVVDKTSYSGPTASSSSVPAPPLRSTAIQTTTATTTSASSKKDAEEVTAGKVEVKLMDRRLSKAISDILGDKISESAGGKSAKWRRLAKHSVPGISSDDMKKLFTGQGVASVLPGPRLIIFQLDDNSVFGIMVSATNTQSGSTSWITDPESCLFSVIHGTPSRESVVAKKIVLPAQASMLGHFFVANSTVLVGQGSDLYIDINTGVCHSNPGITFRVPEGTSFQSKEAHSLLTGRPGLSRVNGVEMWGLCPPSLLPHYQRPTLPLLRSLLNTFNSSALANAENKRWHAEMTSTVQGIIKKISAMSQRRAMQVEEELLRVFSLKPTPLTRTPIDSERNTQDPSPWNSDIVNCLIELKYPGMSVLPFDVTSPDAEDARSLTTPTWTAPTSAPEVSEPLDFETTIKLTTTDSIGFSQVFATHIVLEHSEAIEGLVFVHQTPEQVASSEISSDSVDNQFANTAKEWYQAHTDGEHLNFSVGARAEDDDAISEEAEMASTEVDNRYSVLPLPGKHLERSTSKRVASGQTYDLPSFVTANQPLASFSVSSEEAGTKPLVIALPCAVPAYQVVLAIKYRATKQTLTAGLRQIAVIGYNPSKNDNILPPPLPSSVQNVDEVFFLPRSVAKPTKMIERECNYVSDGDDNGVLFVLGTSQTPEEVADTTLDRTGKTWVNPVASGQILFKVSHGFYNKTTMNVELASSRPLEGSGVTCFWGGTGSSSTLPFLPYSFLIRFSAAPTWFIIDLRSWRLAMTCFTLRHGYHYDNSFATNVVMHGANCEGDEPSETDWVELWSCKDPIFDKSFQVKTFEVTNKVATHFKFFRFLQHGSYTMGKSTAPGAPFMPLSGVEIYGHLERDQNADPEEETDPFESVVIESLV